MLFDGERYGGELFLGEVAGFPRKDSSIFRDDVPHVHESVNSLIASCLADVFDWNILVTLADLAPMLSLLALAVSLLLLLLQMPCVASGEIAKVAEVFMGCETFRQDDLHVMGELGIAAVVLVMVDDGLNFRFVTVEIGNGELHVEVMLFQLIVQNFHVILKAGKCHAVAEQGLDHFFGGEVERVGVALQVSDFLRDGVSIGNDFLNAVVGGRFLSEENSVVLFQAGVTNKTDARRPVVASMVDKAVMSGLTNPIKHTWTEEEKAKARATLGISGGGGTQLYKHEMIMDRTTDDTGDEYFYKITITLPTSQAFAAFVDLMQYLSDNGLQSLFRMYYVRNGGVDERAYYNLISGGYHTNGYNMFPHCTMMDNGTTSVVSLEGFITNWKTFEEYTPIPL